MALEQTVFEAQTASLRYHLGGAYVYDFLDGSHPWPAAKGISEMFGDQQIYYSYSDGSAESTVEAVNDLAEYVRENGPFDAVMGFSLGAALAATFLLREERLLRQLARAEDVELQVVRGIKCAIFLSGTLPCDWDDGTQKRNMRFLGVEDVGEKISIPTVHAWGMNDLDYPGQSRQLAEMCEDSKRVEVLHSAGHGVPSQGKDLINVVDAIRRATVQME